MTRHLRAFWVLLATLCLFILLVYGTSDRFQQAWLYEQEQQLLAGFNETSSQADMILRLQRFVDEYPESTLSPMLAQLYTKIGAFKDARAIWDQILDQKPDNQEARLERVVADFYAAPGGELQPRSVELLDMILAFEPMHEQAHFFKGFAELSSGKAGEALERWRWLRSRAMDQGNQARVDGLDQVIELALEENPELKKEKGPSLRVRWLLEGFELSELPEAARIFILLKQKGSKVPVVVKRQPVTLTGNLTLDSSAAMIPGSKIQVDQQYQVELMLSIDGTVAGRVKSVSKAVLFKQGRSSMYRYLTLRK